MNYPQRLATCQHYIKEVKIETDGKTKVIVKKAGYGGYAMLPIGEKNLYVLQDVKDFSPVSIRNVFDANKDFRDLYLIDLNQDAQGKSYCTMNDLVKEFELDLLNPIKLSAHAKIISRKSVFGKITIFVYERGKQKFSRSSIDALEEDTNEKVWMQITNINGSYAQKIYGPFIDGNKKVSFNTLDNFLKMFPNLSIYGFKNDIEKNKLEELFEKTDTKISYIEDHINAFIDIQSSELSKEEIKFVHDIENHHNRYDSATSHDLAEHIISQENQFLDPNNVVLQWAVALTSYQKKVEKLKAYFFVLDFFFHAIKEKDFGTFREHMVNIKKTYPMFKFLESGWNSRKGDINDVIEYINLVDETMLHKLTKKTA